MPCVARIVCRGAELGQQPAAVHCRPRSLQLSLSRAVERLNQSRLDILISKRDRERSFELR
eukprot:SAG11_NODE_17772_length_509_cov_1.124390_1_plen_60_part_10